MAADNAKVVAGPGSIPADPAAAGPPWVAAARSRSTRAILASDLTTLRLVLAVAGSGSVSAAAQQCCQSVAAVSKRIKEFEQRLDLLLFERGPRGMAPTDAGQAVLRYARLVLELSEALGQDLEQRRVGAQGRVALCANASALLQYLPGDLTAFAESHPQVQVQVGERSSAATVEALVAARADLGIHDADYSQAGVAGRLYRREQFIVLTPPGHPLAQRQGKVRLAEVLLHEMVALPPETAAQAHVARGAAQLGQRPVTRLQAHSFEAACHFVATGVGVSIMPAGVSHHWVQQQRVACVPLDEAWAERRLQLSWATQRPLAPASVLFRDFLLARCCAD